MFTFTGGAGKTIRIGGSQREGPDGEVNRICIRFIANSHDMTLHGEAREVIAPRSTPQTDAASGSRA